MTARIAPVLLALCLLAAWQSAALHPLQHVDADGRLVHLSDYSKQDKRPSSDPSSKLCDALAGLTACAGGEARIVVPVPALDAPLVHESGAPRAASAPPFFAQGPPSFL